MRIRREAASDHAAIRAVNNAAFETPVEADIVEELRSNGVRLDSLVADVDGAIVGHALFSPAVLAAHPQLKIMGLGPMSVVPDQQRKGIGSALVREGLKRCKELGYLAVIVIGHPQYYPRFGFVPAVRYRMRSQYDVPEDAFMVAELEAGALQGASGLVRYDEAFGSV